jgi:hypothetical protein
VIPVPSPAIVISSDGRSLLKQCELVDQAISVSSEKPYLPQSGDAGKLLLGPSDTRVLRFLTATPAAAKHRSNHVLWQPNGLYCCSDQVQKQQKPSNPSENPVELGKTILEVDLSGFIIDRPGGKERKGGPGGSNHQPTVVLGLSDNGERGEPRQPNYH